MVKILIQNILRDFQNDDYLLLSCKPSGLINAGDYIILKENIKVKIIDIEEGLYGTLSLSVKKESLSDPEINYDFLYNKKFLIQKKLDKS